MRHAPGLLGKFVTSIVTLIVSAVVLAGCVSLPGSTPPASLSSASQRSAVASTAEGSRSAGASGSPAAAATAAAEPTASALSAGASPSPTASASSTQSASSAADPARRNLRLYPNPRLTPGDVLPVTAAQVSVPGYASRARHVTVAEKRQVFAEYHLSYPQPAGAYECDHFIPLSLGGSNSIENLWPEPAPQFHWKDGFELYLWHQVRARKITLAEAQREMRTDWYAYWVKAGKP